MSFRRHWRYIRSLVWTLGWVIRGPVLFLIWLYQCVVSPFLPRSCRFFPSCSAYSFEAIRRFGLVTGGLLATKRILKCNPLFLGGYDPVPRNPTEDGTRQANRLLPKNSPGGTSDICKP